MAICAKTLTSGLPREDYKIYDSRFGNEAVRNAFTNFQTFDPRCQNESSALALVWIDAVITDTFDAFHVGRSSYESISFFDFSPDCGKKWRGALRNPEKLRKSGTATEERSKSIKELLPEPASSFLCYCYQKSLHQLESENTPKHIIDVKVCRLSHKTTDL